MPLYTKSMDSLCQTSVEPYNKRHKFWHERSSFPRLPFKCAHPNSIIDTTMYHYSFHSGVQRLIHGYREEDSSTALPITHKESQTSPIWSKCGKVGTDATVEVVRGVMRHGRSKRFGSLWGAFGEKRTSESGKCPGNLEISKFGKDRGSWRHNLLFCSFQPLLPKSTCLERFKFTA